MAQKKKNQKGRLSAVRSNELLCDLKDTLQTVADTGSAGCKLCGFQVTGSDYGEILEKLGRHAEEAHGNQFLVA